MSAQSTIKKLREENAALRDLLQRATDTPDLTGAITKALATPTGQVPVAVDVVTRLIRGEAPAIRKALDADREGGLLSNDALTDRLRKNREKTVEDSGGDTGNRNLYSRY